MDAKKWIKRGIEILLALTLPFAMTSVVAQGQEEADLPSAVGQLSEYYASTMMMAGYPTYPGENLPLYPGDEKWNGHYVMPAYAGTAPLLVEPSQSPKKELSDTYLIEPAYLNPYETISVNALATRGSDIFAGLDRINENGEEESILARWYGIGWDRRARVTNTSSSSSVDVVEIHGENTYIGGRFDAVGGVPANNIALLNHSGWQALGSGINRSTPLASKIVEAIAVAPDGTVYAGGAFDQAGSLTVSNIARWNGTVWQDVGGGVNGPVLAIVAMGNNIYVGGYFTQAGGKSIRNIARWDGNTWQSVGGGIAGEGVSTLSVYGNDLYAAAEQDGSGWKISRWNGTNWFDLGNEPADWAGVITNLRAAASGVYAIGQFFGFGDYLNVNHIAYWNGVSWAKMGSGVNGLPRDILVLDDTGYVGGAFDFAGNNHSTGFASWHRMPELIPYYYWDMYAWRGRTLYLIGNYFTADQPAQLSVNGVVLKDDLVTDADGKIYIHLQTSQDAEPGQYEVKLTVGNETAVWRMWLGTYSGPPDPYDYDGYIVSLPASLPPLSESYLPLITK